MASEDERWDKLLLSFLDIYTCRGARQAALGGTKGGTDGFCICDGFVVFAQVS